LNFLHLVAADHGGAGIAAWRLHDGLRALGHVSRMLVLDRRSEDPDVIAFADKRRSVNYKRIVNKAWLKLCSHADYYFQNQTFSSGLDAAVLGKIVELKPDVLVVHFISFFLSPENIQALHRATGAPVLWHLLDMGLLTGGCHYAWHCDGYLRECGRCPALRWGSANDLSARTWRSKQSTLARTRGLVVAGSSLLARQASASSLFGSHHIETLLLGVSPNTFKPRDKVEIRSNIGVQVGDKIVLFGAQRFDQRRKGMHLLMQSLVLLAERWPAETPLPVLLSIGNATDFTSLCAKGFRMINLGFVDGQTLATAYAAADLFACPSIEDSGPMMINESMMSGTPVVAFRMGVAEDLIEDGITGVIAKNESVADFADGMRRVLLWDDMHMKAARHRCRDVALKKCSSELQPRRFADIAHALVSMEGQEMRC
jgi:glycosyltransferase involved in cell wall biosynthesis